MMYLAIIATLIVATRSQPVAECDVDLDCATGEVCDFPGTPIATCYPQCENTTVCIGRYVDYTGGGSPLNVSDIICVNDGSVDKCGALLCENDADCAPGVCYTDFAPVVHMCVECVVHADCVNASAPICDTAHGLSEATCVECLADTDCIDGEEYCHTDSGWPYCETTCAYEETLDAAYCSDSGRVCDPAYYDCVYRQCYPDDVSNCGETVIVLNDTWGNITGNVTFPEVCNTDDISNWFCDSANCANTDGFCAVTNPGEPVLCQPDRSCGPNACIDDSYCEGIPYPNCFQPDTPDWLNDVGDFGICIDNCTAYAPWFCPDWHGDWLTQCVAETGKCQNVACSADADCAPFWLACDSGTGLCDYGCANQTVCDDIYWPGSGYICQDSGLCALDSCSADADCNSTETYGFVCADQLCVEGCRDNGGDDYCYHPEFLSLCNNDTGLCAPIPCATYDNCSVYSANYTCGDDFLCTYGCSNSMVGCDGEADGVAEAFWAYYVCDATDEQCRVDPPGCADDGECAVTFGSDAFRCNDDSTCWEYCEHDGNCYGREGPNSVCVAGEGCTVDEGCLVHGCRMTWELINMVPEEFGLASDFSMPPFQIPCNMFIHQMIQYECDFDSVPMFCDADSDCDMNNGYVCSTIEVPTDASNPYGSLARMCVLRCSDDDVCDALWGNEMAVEVNGGAPTTCNVATGQCSYTDECDNDCAEPFNLCTPISFQPKFCVTTCATDEDCDVAWGDSYGVGTVPCVEYGPISVCYMVGATLSPTRSPTESPISTTPIATDVVGDSVERRGIFGAIAFVFVVISRMF